MPLLSEPLSTEETQLIVSIIDLTTLSDDDTQEKVSALCKNASTPSGHVAAVCAFPKFLTTMCESIKDPAIKIATVVNFPFAKDDLQTSVESIKKSVSEGANEIDIVMPYHDLLEGNDFDQTANYLKTCKQACGPSVTYKVILETGALKNKELIRLASQIAIDAGADFIKTSTGKTEVGATPDAVKTMLSVIKESQRPIGLKVSGGVRTVSQAQEYLQLVSDEMGAYWITPGNFRIGSSSLLKNVLDQGE